ncbi:hypothetical protein LAZ67_7001286 [Cordylochernes scorpioides]|uniref:Uncharacterized protein n=1 Tax=Cordylochernes scorpioides TaxID=51811 RepID=A0ABY6KM48_9ARAC|nr:hypothetical protein LAZ67_7001286 [Cordylochernes scorpioides]
MSRSQLLIGRLPTNVRERDVEQVFEKYGRLLRCNMKYGGGMAYAFVDYDDRRDAEDALHHENGCDIKGQSIIVEWARGPSYRSGSSRGECFRCRRPGHWARDCPELERDHERYYSRRRSRSRSPRRRRRTRSYSRSQSRTRDRSRGKKSKLSLTKSVTPRSKSPSPRCTKSGKARSPSRSKSRSRSYENSRNKGSNSPRKSCTPSPYERNQMGDTEQNGENDVKREMSKSPSRDRESIDRSDHDRSHSRSGSPARDKSP